MTKCRGGDYCDEVCPAPGMCGHAPVTDDEGRYTHHTDRVTVPARGSYVVVDGIMRRAFEFDSVYEEELYAVEEEE